MVFGQLVMPRQCCAEATAAALPQQYMSRPSKVPTLESLVCTSHTFVGSDVDGTEIHGTARHGQSWHTHTHKRRIRVSTRLKLIVTAGTTKTKADFHHDR